MFYLLMRLEWPCFRNQMSSGSLEHLCEMRWCGWLVENAALISALANDLFPWTLPSMALRQRSRGDGKMPAFSPFLPALVFHTFPNSRHPVWIVLTKWVVYRMLAAFSPSWTRSLACIQGYGCFDVEGIPPFCPVWRHHELCRAQAKNNIVFVIFLDSKLRRWSQPY